jgi:hypothetical protein
LGYWVIELLGQHRISQKKAIYLFLVGRGDFSRPDFISKKLLGNRVIKTKMLKDSLIVAGYQKNATLQQKSNRIEDDSQKK